MTGQGRADNDPASWVNSRCHYWFPLFFVSAGMLYAPVRVCVVARVWCCA